jgi:tetratricopeptide (TPR) repeat protein
VTTIALRRLPRAAVVDLMARISMPTNDASDLANAVFDRTEGNPLFLTEALRDARDHPDAWREPESRAWTGSDRLRSLIAARRARLSPDGQEIAEVAAVIGHGFNVDVVRDVTGFTEERVLDGIDDLLDRHFIREAGGRGRFDYAFTHHLVHAAIYEAAEPQLRSRRHRRVARTLEDRAQGGDVSLGADLALHHERGGDGPRAAAWYLVAANAAEHVYAHHEAIRFATRAAELTTDERERAAALLVREAALSRTGDRAAQRRDIDEAMNIATRVSDDDLTWQLLLRRMHLERSLGKQDEESAVISELERRAASGSNSRQKAEALLARANHLVSLTSHVQARGPAQEALRHYESLEDVAGQVEALSILTEIATNVGELDASQRLLGAVRQKAASHPDKGLLLRAISAAVITALQQHRIADAADLAAEGVTLARALGDREEEAAMLQRLAVTATWQRDFDLARRRFAAAAEAFDAIGHLRGTSHAQSNQAVLALRLGLLDEARALCDRALMAVERTGDRRPLAVTFVNLSLIHILQGDPAGAKRLALEGLEVARAVGFPLFEGAALANLGNAERALGNFDVGLQHIKKGLQIREGLLSPTDVLDDYCDLALGSLQAQQRTRSLSATAKLLRIAEDSTEGAFWPHVCFWTAALVHHAAGKATTADGLLQRAVAEMRTFAAAIADSNTRAAFLMLPACRQIEGAAERDEWPEYARGAATVYDSGKGKAAKPPARGTRQEKRVERRRTTN